MQQKPQTERINILRQDLGSSNLIDILKEMIRRGRHVSFLKEADYI